MAEADKDGRAAQIVSDLMATTVMSMNEGISEARNRFRPKLGETMTPSTLVEFLTARITEDEGCGSFDPFDPELGRKRLAAECAAKRQIVAECKDVLTVDGWEYTDTPDLAEHTLRALASAYADHPDFRTEWRM